MMKADQDEKAVNVWGLMFFCALVSLCMGWRGRWFTQWINTHKIVGITGEKKSQCHIQSFLTTLMLQSLLKHEQGQKRLDIFVLKGGLG